MRTDDSALARAVARTQGVSPGADVDWVVMGAACREAIRRQLPPPTTAAYRRGRAVDTVPPPPPSPAHSVSERPNPMAPRSVREVMEMRRMRLITQAEARIYLGLPARWWRGWR